MTKYKGYYIDNVHFNSKHDIDKFLEKQALEAFKNACWLFNRRLDMESSIIANEKAEYLVKNFGYTWDRIEAIEIETLRTA